MTSEYIVSTLRQGDSTLEVVTLIHLEACLLVWNHVTWYTYIMTEQPATWSLQLRTPSPWQYNFSKQISLISSLLETPAHSASIYSTHIIQIQPCSGGQNNGQLNSHHWNSYSSLFFSPACSTAIRTQQMWKHLHSRHELVVSHIC